MLLTISELPNKRTGTFKFNDGLCRIYVISTALEMILRKFPVVWWLNQVSMTCNKEAMSMRLIKSVKFNHTGMPIRKLRVLSSIPSSMASDINLKT